VITVGDALRNDYAADFVHSAGVKNNSFRTVGVVVITEWHQVAVEEMRVVFGVECDVENIVANSGHLANRTEIGSKTLPTGRIPGSTVVLMSDCCDPIPYRRFFNTKEANRRLKNYRKRGLDARATDIVDYLKTQDLAGSDVLEIGGGVGDLQVELLKAGAGKAINVELSDAYEDVAIQLAEDEGFGDRMTRQFGDFVDVQDELESADIVVLNRVVCCYPFMERMMNAAVSKTDKHLGLVFPRGRWWTRTFFGLGNKYWAVRSCDFRGFVHPPDEIEKVATDNGFVVRHRSNDLTWQAVVFEKVA